MKPLKFLALIVFFLGLSLSARASSATATAGDKVVISVTADGTTPFTYQWKKAGASITGATLATLTFDPVALTDAGVYTVTVANSAGNTLSDTATLTVVPLVVAPSNAVTHFDVTKAAGTGTGTGTGH
jgi:N-acetylmuramic acid 6-phosphate (MurNAc-6-P) etherase